jgi:hypothetical protein
MEKLTIKSRHASLAEAVETAKVDLSYNPAEAARSIKDCDTGFNGRCPGVTKAFVTDQDKVYYIFRTEDKMNILHEFEPFHSALDSYAMKIAMIQGDEIIITDAAIAKNKDGRKFFAENQHLIAA